MSITNITSFVFNLVIFSFVALWVAYKILNVKIADGKNLRKDKLYNWFTWFGVFALMSQLSYVYAPKRIFSNANHHVIEHLGFSFQQKLSLVNQQNPDEAIWDNKNGKLSINFNSDKNSFELRGDDFYEPIYVKNTLANPIINTPLEKQLDVQLNDSLGVSFYIGAKEGLYSVKTNVNETSYGPFVLPITQPLHNGYSLGGMLNRISTDAPYMSAFVAALDSVYILRKTYKHNEKNYDENPLMVFPSGSFLQNHLTIKIDGKNIKIPQNNKVNIAINATTPFYLGLWNTQTKTYQVNRKDNQSNLADLLVTFPSKKYLKRLESTQETLFLTSSSDEIANSDLVSGFYYPIMENDANQNHFSATLTYNEGSTIEKMNFKVVNLDQDDLEKSANQIYAAGDTIQLKSKGLIADKNSMQWLFKIKDLKADNPLQFWHLIGFTLLIVLMIFISIYLTPHAEQSKTEYLIYLLLLTVLTIRSVLLWRASTFVPTEDVSENVYYSLTNGMFENFKNGVIATIIFFVGVWIWKVFSNRIANSVTNIFPNQKEAFSLKYLFIFGLYIIPFAVKLAGVERIGAVYLPIVVYIFIEFWFLNLLHRNQQSSVLSNSYRIVASINWAICFGYLAFSDAGFSIVFFISTLIYWLLQLLTFPDYLKNTNNSTLFGKLKHWRFIVPILVLTIFIITAPYLISFVFQKTQWIIIGFAVLLILLSIYLFVKKQSLPILQSIPSKLTLSVFLIAFASIIFIFRGKIDEKIQEKGYIRYRAEVLFKTPDEIIQDEQFKFNLGNDSKLLRAAQNQWFINYYYENGATGWFKPFVNLAKGNYFQLLPSFQKGSPYLTQISDLVSVRYVIGEHSQLIIINLLILMILLILSAIGKEISFNFYSKLRVLILCLLFTVGFFIWMAATNRIIFLGQDFPLLSLNSVLTLIFTFTILFFAIVFGKQAQQQEYAGGFNAVGKNVFKKVIRGLLLVAICLIAFREHDFSEKRFNLDTTIESLRQDFMSLNESFATFQQDKETLKLPLSKLLSDFDLEMKKNNAAIFKTAFSKSAYEAYMVVLKKNNNPQNLVHVKRGSDGIYEFAINKLYYDVTSPDVSIDAWRGHLIASDNPNSFGLKNRENNKQFNIKPNQSSSSLEQELDKNNLTEYSENHNIRMTVIPSGWSVDSLPKILLSTTFGQQTPNRSVFTIKNNGEIIHSETTPYAITLQPDDVVQFIPEGKNKPTTLQYKHQSNLYLAKNVWLNGKNQFFYPLKHKFIWSYQFANLVKSKFDGDIEKRKQNLELTIDPMLTEQIYDKAENYFSQSIKWDKATENARAFNLVVIDSDGKIKALSDFKKGTPFKLDPNRMTEFRENLDNFYLNSNTDGERLIFGNRCLMRSDNGPASTFKPILYASVTSQFNFDWQSLAFGGLEMKEKAGFLKRINNDDFLVKKFGGKPVKFALGSPNFPIHTNIEYISHSTNSYNSMIVFLGSLDKPQINNLNQYVRGINNDSTFLKRGFSVKEEENFPNFNINNQSYHINKFPSRWDNDQSLIAKGLWENFNFPVRAEQLNNQEGQNIQNIAYQLDSVGFAKSRSSYKLWSFPEPSHLYLIDRNSLHNAIVQCATGADPINTTPYKMAEMAATLFSFNKAFKGTVLANSKYKYHPIGFDGSWGNANNLSSFYAKNLFVGMNQALQVGGTAHNLVGNMLAKMYPQYNFYAKTGTISGNRYGGKRDKHLMLIISKEQIHGRSLSPQDLKSNRFYVLYFSFYKQSQSAEWDDAAAVLQDMTKTVIQSNSFQTFMNHE